MGARLVTVEEALHRREHRVGQFPKLATVLHFSGEVLEELRNNRRLQTAMRYQSHRGAGVAATVIFIKRRVLMPMFRWLFEYSRDNFERQRRVNDVLFACVQELAIENARLRRDVQALTDRR